nr:hypothetical protein [Candidatus Sigynarchaeota archaeon]
MLILGLNKSKKAKRCLHRHRSEHAGDGGKDKGIDQSVVIALGRSVKAIQTGENVDVLKTRHSSA